VTFVAKAEVADTATTNAARLNGRRMKLSPWV
jgi:hypothetical protein